MLREVLNLLGPQGMSKQLVHMSKGEDDELVLGLASLILDPGAGVMNSRLSDDPTSRDDSADWTLDLDAGARDSRLSGGPVSREGNLTLNSDARAVDSL